MTGQIKDLDYTLPKYSVLENLSRRKAANVLGFGVVSVIYEITQFLYADRPGGFQIRTPRESQ